MPVAALSPSSDFVTACYIVAFSLFIFGVRQGTHPTTARRGNLIAAAGMAIAVAITLSLDVIGNGVLIVLGILIGTLVGGVASRRVQMTADAADGGALQRRRRRRRGADRVGGVPPPARRSGGDIPLDVLIPILFSMVVGSVSFWGSNIAFAKLQELISGRPIRFPGQHIVNGILLAGILAGCVVLAANHDSEPSQGLFIAVLIAAAMLGNLFVLPIGGADMPVVISLLNAFTGLAAAAAGFALDNVALIVAGTLVGSSGTILTLEMAPGDEPLDRQPPVRRASAPWPPAAGRRRARSAPCTRSAPRTPRSSSPTPTRSSSSPATGWRSPRPSTRSRSSPTSSRSTGSGSATRSTRWRAGCRAT